jgi:flagellar hook-length control protein FliK
VRSDAATGTTTAGGVAQSDNARFVQRVEQAFQSVGDQGGSIRLRLSPPDLGTMQIDISVQKGQLTANVQTDTAQARNLMLDNLPALRESLAQHNIKIETFNVELTGGGTGGMSGQASQYQNQSSENSSSGSNRNAVRSSASTTSVDAPTTSAVNQNGSLNIVI